MTAPQGIAGLCLDECLYPAITRCLCEGCRPERDEVRRVAGRIWKEGFARRLNQTGQNTTFAARRLVLRAAMAALTGESC